MNGTLEHARYRFDRWIATGGMGEVWAATDTLLDREVAVKVLKREYADDPVLRARFAAEARHAGSLQHPHVASVLDYGEISDEERSPLPFLVMELVDGQPLSALLTGGRALAADVAVDLVAQAAEGVGAAHQLGIVHRDVKPGNLLVTADGQVKVTDFGVARAVESAPLTLTGHLVGTPHYLSPEQAEGKAATPASDVYALGLVLFECLTGAKPFVGDSPVVTALMQIREPLPPFPEWVPARLQELVRVAAAKDPAARFQNADALAAALRDESPDTRTFVLPDSVPETPGAESAVPERAAAGPVAGAGSTRPSRRLLLLVVAAVLLLALVGAGWVLASDSDSDPDDVNAATRTSTSDQVRVSEAAFVGLVRAEAVRRLRTAGLEPRVTSRTNPGGEPPGTVAAVSPTGSLDSGDEVVLAVWAAAAASEADDGPIPSDGNDTSGNAGKGNQDGKGKGGGGKGRSGGKKK